MLLLLLVHLLFQPDARGPAGAAARGKRAHDFNFVGVWYIYIYI